MNKPIHLPAYLIGIEHGLAPGIPNIAQQPWKVLEVAVQAV